MNGLAMRTLHNHFDSSDGPTESDLLDAANKFLTVGTKQKRVRVGGRLMDRREVGTALSAFTEQRFVLSEAEFIEAIEAA